MNSSSSRPKATHALLHKGRNFSAMLLAISTHWRINISAPVFIDFQASLMDRSNSGFGLLIMHEEELLAVQCWWLIGQLALSLLQEPCSENNWAEATRQAGQPSC
jgi:hypothetical protein